MLLYLNMMPFLAEFAILRFFMWVKIQSKFKVRLVGSGYSHLQRKAVRILRNSKGAAMHERLMIGSATWS